jgi:hypothetical protein
VRRLAFIAAPQTKVWNLLTNVKVWPTWQPDIANTGIQRDPATRESMDGWVISHFYSSHDLLERDRLWLTRLKQAAES